MSEIEIFQFPSTGEQIRTLVREGRVLFSVADVCRGLQHSNPSVALRLVEEEDRVLVNLAESDSPNLNRTSANPNMWFVTEPGFYALALNSQAPRAREFRRWVTHDVLPQIRMTGRYEPVQHLPQTYAQALRELAASVERAEEAERALAVAEPLAEAWQVLASAEGDYSVREAAFILNRDPAIDTGQQRLFRLLREWKLIDRNNRPYASHSRHVCLRVTHYTHPSTGEEEATTQVRITHAGLQYLHKRMGGVKQLQIVFPSEAA